MSKENAEKFLKDLRANEEFSKEFENIAVDDRAAFLKEKGYCFTKEELDECLESLDEADMQAVAGGHSFSGACYTTCCGFYN
jgi:predicted ribosomally synthesized peptide with nif11-like leader